MKRQWLHVAGGLGLAALVVAPLSVGVAGASPPHSDQVITVSKADATTGAPLSGAVFTLYRWHGSCDLKQVVATATSATNGRAVFNLTGHHNYCVVETKAPAGYVLPALTSRVVKTAHETNTKGSDDRANVKEAAVVAFVDDAVVTPPTSPTGTTTTTVATSMSLPPTSPGKGATTTTTTPTVVPNALIVHTGKPWSGSAPYMFGVAGLGGLLVGGGLLWRRRQLQS